nr:ATP-binding protein [Gemmatimonadales bacterium]
VHAIEPRRTFQDVILPIETLDAIRHALALIKHQNLIFQQWGLAERHGEALGLAFHFAGPPGTGKTIAAEAIAATLGRRLLVVRYAELESRWVGQTAKHVAALFRAASDEGAVLFFDEADAIASRRFTSLTQGYERESNSVVNVLLAELERFPGVVIFATNLAANMDPAFERRIRTHIHFDMPGPVERERIWRVQLHATKTPLAPDVNFVELADRYRRSGGDIKNAVLKAAQIATLEPGPDDQKRIHQRHFIQAMDEVVAAEQVMNQSLYEGRDDPALGPLAGAFGNVRDRQDALEQEHRELAARLDTARAEAESRHLYALGALEERDTGRALELAGAQQTARRERQLLLLAAGALAVAVTALAVALLR